MARKATTILDTTGPTLTPLDEIPDDVKQFVEETYAKQRKSPSRERVEYESEDELKKDFKLMADYVAQRTVNGKAAVLHVRKSPTRGLPDNVMDIRFSADLPANGKKNANNESGQTSR